MPLLRDGEADRRDHRHSPRARRRSPTTQIALLKTFADQAVIAIENVRLFNELRGAQPRPDRGAGAADGDREILRVISSSPTDVQPVFDTIVRSAVRLCDGASARVFRFDGELLHHVAGTT